MWLLVWHIVCMRSSRGRPTDKRGQILDNAKECKLKRTPRPLCTPRHGLQLSALIAKPPMQEFRYLCWLVLESPHALVQYKWQIAILLDARANCSLEPRSVCMDVHSRITGPWGTPLAHEQADRWHHRLLCLKVCCRSSSQQFNPAQIKVQKRAETNNM